MCLLVKAENVAKKWRVTRDEQDRFAVESQKKYQASQQKGHFNAEITPITVKQRKGSYLLAVNHL